MAIFFEGKEIPGSLVKTIISTSLSSKVGFYHGTYHKFHAPKFQPDFELLCTKAEEFGYTKEEAVKIVTYVLGNVETEAKQQLNETLNLVDEKEMPLLSHVKFTEENNSETEMIYLGGLRFYILATNRTTLMPGNIVKARELLLNKGAVWNFDIYKNFSAKKPSVPDGYKKYQAWFQTSAIRSITIYSSPELLTIIDEKNNYGGELASISSEQIDNSLKTIIEDINNVVAYLPDTLNNNEQFSEYLDLLKQAKASGINTYTLHTLIEHIERRVKNEYVSAEKDWHIYMTKEQEEKEKRLQHEKDEQRFNELKSLLENEIGNIKRRRILLFFYASGKVTDEGQKHLNSIIPELEQLAEKGFGTKGYAEARLAEALSDTKPPRWYNLTVAAIIVAVILASSFVAYSWVTAQKSMDVFNLQLESVNKMLDNREFNEAKVFVDEAHDAFKPGYLRFLISGKTNRTKLEIENRIDTFVDERIEQIQTMVKANKNRIDKYSWELIVEAMEFRPDDARLNQLRQQYIAQ